MTTDLKWGRVRLDSATRPVLDRALGALGRRLGAALRLARHHSGKVVACRAGDLWFCRVLDAAEPPRTWTVAVDTRPEPRTLLPLESAADFAECCDLLGHRTAAEQARFRGFLALDPHLDPDLTAPGAP